MNDLREDVCILLNEREDLKARMADELERQLKLRGFSAHRLKPTPGVTSVITERFPRVLVIDYLVGDIGTAFDIFNEIPERDQLKVIIWTDEPSLSVAIDAMKLGVHDYIELGASKSLEKVVAAIESARQETVRIELQPKKQIHSILSEDPVCQSSQFKQTLALAASAANGAKPVVVLLGERGVGRNTIARYIHSCRTDAGACIEIDFDVWPEPAEIICGSPYHPRAVPLLSHQASVVIDHAESDTGELLEHIEKHLSPSSSSTRFDQNVMLIIGTSSEECAREWNRLLQADVIEISALEARKNDFFPLTQRFQSRVQQYGQTNKLQLTSPIIDTLMQLEWPGNVRQLEAVIVEALTIPVDQLARLGEEQQNEISKEFTKNERLLLFALLAAKQRWETFQLIEYPVPNALSARRALDESFGNFRLAALKLGTSIPRLRQVLDKTPQKDI